MIVAVTGSRVNSDALKAHVFRTLDAIHAETPIALVISGACVNKETGEMSGADRFAIDWALANEVDFNGRPARWKKEGWPMAGPMRNRRVLEELTREGLVTDQPFQLVAFEGNRGTANCRAQAAEMNVPTRDAALSLDELVSHFNRKDSHR